MYLLYEKEVHEAIRSELELLLRWITETKKLNPTASIDDIVNAAGDKVKTDVYKIRIDSSSKPKHVKEEVREAVEAERDIVGADAITIATVETATVEDYEPEDYSAEVDEAVEEEIIETEPVAKEEPAVEYSETTEYDDDFNELDDEDEPVEEEPVVDTRDSDLERQNKIRVNQSAIFGNPSDIDDL